MGCLVPVIFLLLLSSLISLQSDNIQHNFNSIRFVELISKASNMNVLSMLCNNFKIMRFGRWQVECSENIAWILAVDSIVDVFCIHDNLCLVVYYVVERGMQSYKSKSHCNCKFVSFNSILLPIFYDFLFDEYNGKIVVFLVPLMSLCLFPPPTCLTLHSPIYNWFVASLTWISKFYISCHLLLSPPSPSISLTSLTLIVAMARLHSLACAVFLALDIYSMAGYGTTCLKSPLLRGLDERSMTSQLPWIT